MESLDPALLSFWMKLSALLVTRVCMVVTAAFACIRLQWVRRALRGLETSWPHRLTMIVVFGGLGVLGNHFGILVTVVEDKQTVIDAAELVGFDLKGNQAVIGFRDTMVLVGGLIGGPWVGLGSGLIAGIERDWLGGPAATGSGVATLVLGVFAGLVRHFRSQWAATPKAAIVVALIGTLLHRLILLIFMKQDLAVILTQYVAMPLVVSHVLGCVLFIWVVRDLDRDKLESEARASESRERQARQDEQEARLQQQMAESRERQARQDEQEARLLYQGAELCILRAQAEPHFFKNTLGAIHALIRIDPDQARKYVIEMADFFRSTVQNANSNTIPLREEWEQTQRYLDLQQLRFGEKQIRYQFTDLPPGILDYRLPTYSLITLAENSLTHGRRGCPEGLEPRFEAIDRDDESFELRVIDNGCGMDPELRNRLGKEPVKSASPHGNGLGLYYLSRSLHLAFGDRANLAFNPVTGGGTEVVLTLPKKI